LKQEKIMGKREQFMVGGAIVFVIGLAITPFGYNRFKGVEGVLTQLAMEAPAGAIEATIGFALAAVGMFVAIHSFGQMEETR
jgi:hypothetical protein